MGDAYVWAAVTGSWDVAANWDDTTAGLDPASVAPGSNDSVTVGAAGGGATDVITGTGDSASLTIDGATVPAGQFTTGALTVANGGGLQLNAGDMLTVTGNASVQQRRLGSAILLSHASNWRGSIKPRRGPFWRTHNKSRSRCSRGDNLRRETYGCSTSFQSESRHCRSDLSA